MGFEHILVLRQSQQDQNGISTAGTLVVNRPGTSHTVYSMNGCVVLAIWEKPVQFAPVPAPEAAALCDKRCTLQHIERATQRGSNYTCEDFRQIKTSSIGAQFAISNLQRGVMPRRDRFGARNYAERPVEHRR